MTILLIVADLGLGGAQQVVINLANGFASEGYKVGVWDVFPEFRMEGVTSKISDQVALIGEQPIKKPAGLIYRMLNSILCRTGLQRNYWKHLQQQRHEKAIKDWVKKEQPYVVNSHVWWADKWVYDNRNWLPSNWWITMHGSYTAMMRYDLEDAFLKESSLILKTCSGFMYLSECELDAIKSIQGWVSKPIYKIPNGLPEPSFQDLSREEFGLKETDFVLLCASRAIREKGWKELVEAVILLNNDYPNIRLLFAGDGSYRKELEETIQMPEIQFLGFRSDVSSLIRIADCVLLPSYTEALPTILLESIQLGVPVIATQVGEVSSIVNLEGDRPAGILINLTAEGKPDLLQLVQAIEEMLDSNNRNRYIENIKRTTFPFLLENQISNYLKVFNSFSGQ